jgi:hypothetical protein
MFSMDILPEAKPQSITKAEGLALKHNSLAEYCGPQTKSF